VNISEDEKIFCEDVGLIIIGEDMELINGLDIIRKDCEVSAISEDNKVVDGLNDVGLIIKGENMELINRPDP